MTQPSSFALFGHPVGHSLSPLIHAAAYAALSLPHRYHALDVRDEAALEARVLELRRGALRGANVTVPWKRRALALADRAHPLAARLGAANVLSREGDELVAHNTDVLALVGEFARVAGGARRALVIGSGGAALAAVAALSERELHEVDVVACGFSSAVDRATWQRFEALGASPSGWPEAGSTAWRERVTRYDLIVQATSAGMLGADDGEGVAQLLPDTGGDRTVVAYDVVYNPAVTPFLREAAKRKLVAEGGLGMLVEQAALAFELWLGVGAPRDVMAAAARRGLNAEASA